MNESDRARIEWCIIVMQDIANLGRDKVLGDMYPHTLQVLGALKRVLEPTID